MKRPLGVLFLALVAGLSLACGAAPRSAGSDPAAGGPTKPNPRLPTAVLRSGAVQVLAELAVSPEERERGLMFRKELKRGEGMLFVFEADQQLAFWMKNTSIPLSIAYLASDGTIREILDMEPFSLASHPSERSVRYALEVPKGWFAEVGLGPGDRFELPALGSR